MKSDSSTLVAYVPAPHAGYVKFLKKHAGSVLYVLGEDLIENYQSLVRHLPGNNPSDAAAMVRALGVCAEVRLLCRSGLPAFAASHTHAILPDEDISRAFAEKHLPGIKVMFDGSVWLRWDWKSTTHKRRPDGEGVISLDSFDRECMARALGFARRSPDWWRQIGALLVRDGKALLGAYNTHFPSEHSNYLCGDPRSNFEPGQMIDASSALHAEMGVITEAARRGISTEGCDLYVTTFPCPPCAYGAANSGIRRLFYAEGYSLVAGAEALASRGVEIIRVDMQNTLAPA